MPSTRLPSASSNKCKHPHSTRALFVHTPPTLPPTTPSPIRTGQPTTPSPKSRPSTPSGKGHSPSHSHAPISPHSPLSNRPSSPSTTLPGDSTALRRVVDKLPMSERGECLHLIQSSLSRQNQLETQLTHESARAAHWKVEVDRLRVKVDELSAQLQAALGARQQMNELKVANEAEARDYHESVRVHRSLSAMQEKRARVLDALLATIRHAGALGKTLDQVVEADGLGTKRSLAFQITEVSKENRALIEKIEGLEDMLTHERKRVRSLGRSLKSQKRMNARLASRTDMDIVHAAHSRSHLHLLEDLHDEEVPTVGDRGEPCPRISMSQTTASDGIDCEEGLGGEREWGSKQAMRADRLIVKSLECKGAEPADVLDRFRVLNQVCLQIHRECRTGVEAGCRFTISAAVTRLFHCDWCGVFIQEVSMNTPRIWRLSSSHPHTREFVEDDTIPAIIGIVMEQGIVRRGCVDMQGMISRGGAQEGDVMGVPLRSDHGVIGVLVLAEKQGMVEAFNDVDEAIAGYLGCVVGGALAGAGEAKASFENCRILTRITSMHASLKQQSSSSPKNHQSGILSFDPSSLALSFIAQLEVQVLECLRACSVRVCVIQDGRLWCVRNEVSSKGASTLASQSVNVESCSICGRVVREDLDHLFIPSAVVDPDFNELIDLEVGPLSLVPLRAASGGVYGIVEASPSLSQCVEDDQMSFTSSLETLVNLISPQVEKHLKASLGRSDEPDPRESGSMARSELLKWELNRLREENIALRIKDLAAVGPTVHSMGPGAKPGCARRTWRKYKTRAPIRHGR